MDSKKILISVIIPCFNEEERLPNTLKQIEFYIKNNKKFSFEIIIVDDGSRDKTIKIATDFQKKNPHVKIIKNGQNRGKGFSVRRGMLESRGDFSLFMDADSATKISELDKFLPFLEKYNILIGSRHLSTNSIKVKQTILRRIAGFFAHKLIHLFIIPSIKDTMCGFKVFDKKSRILFKKQLNKRWGFDYEILYLAKKFDFKVKEIPIFWEDDKRSKVTLRGYLNALFELFKIKWNDFLGRYNDNYNRSN